MTWKGNDPAIEFTNVNDLRAYIQSLNYASWRPSNFVVHNTASPTLYQWWHSVPPAQRMENLQHYYENDMGWSAGPHFFIDGKSWWCMTPPNVKGVHSPSWNGTMLGFEHVGDYETESATSGMGADVQRMGHELSAICCEFFGWNPEALKFHYEDPNTDHACPGSNMQKGTYIGEVQQCMGDGGDDHDKPSRPHHGVVDGLAEGDTLNIRASSSSSSPVIGTADNGDELRVVGEAMNGSTRWLRVQFGRAAGAGVAVYGWVSAEYVVEENPPADEGGPLHEDIFATTFGGKADDEYSSYGPYDSSGRGPYLNDTEYYVALPCKIAEQPRVKVWNRATGKSGVGRLMDVGPWCTKDPYWDTNTRPQAEISWHAKTPLPDWTGTHAGEVAGNPAGIDLSPALFKALGMTDNGPVDWCFEEDAPGSNV